MWALRHRKMLKDGTKVHDNTRAMHEKAKGLPYSAA